MSHAGPSATEAVNADSFLDIVASVVSVMIIMVVMTGLKIKSSPVDAASVPVAAVEESSVESAEEESARREVQRTETELEELRKTASLRRDEYASLAERVTEQRRRTEALRARVEERTQQGRALSRGLSEAQAALGEREKEIAAAESAPGPVEQVECYPTPLSRAVEKLEIHLRLRGGRVAVVPIDSLIWKFKADARSKVDRLREQPEMTDLIGPENGFWFRYTLERVEGTPETARKTGHGGDYVQLKRWTIVPESDDVGEPLDRALGEGSALRQALAEARAKGATVTVWTYPDGFDAFRKLKKELYRMGFAVAGRPLPEGVMISGAPEGSRSAAQ